MDGKIVFRKTAKGKHEVETRAKDIEPQLRLVLIMVNGELSFDELHLQLDRLNSFDSAAQLEDSLVALIEFDFITDTSKFTEKIRAEYGKKKWSEDKIINTKARLIGKTDELLGGNSKRVVNKLQNSANTIEGLAIAIDKCEKAVRLFIDEDIAKKLTSEWRLIIAEERGSK